ncbi:MAG: hypothetical protein AB1305_03715 [Candidatus Hadarchaeota archaeon]
MKMRNLTARGRARLACGAAFCALVMLSTAQAAWAGELVREKFVFIYENSENVVQEIPAAPSPSAPASAPASSGGSGQTGTGNGGNADFTVEVSPSSQRILNRIKVNEFKDGNLTTRYVDSYGEGFWAVKVDRFRSFTVAVSSLNGFSGEVSLGVSGVPNAASYSYPARVRVPAGGQALTVISVNTTASTREGSYTITVTGTHGGVARSDSAALEVYEESGEASDFSNSLGPMHDGGSSAKPGTMTAAYVVDYKQPVVTIDGATVPNYRSETMKQKEVEKASGFRITVMQVARDIKGAITQVANAVATAASSGMDYTNKIQPSPHSTRSNSSTTCGAINLALNILRTILKTR